MRLLDSQEMREIDQYTIEKIGIPEAVLMENAASAWVEGISHYLKNRKTFFIFCGSGNNGGDGYVIARILASRGYKCYTVEVIPPKSNCCLLNSRIWKYYGENLSWQNFVDSPPLIKSDDILIDAILGTGIERKIEGIIKRAVDLFNNIEAIKLAVDVPTGINASTGDICGTAIKVDETVTFHKEKVGHHFYPGKEYRGKLQRKNISVLELPGSNERKYELIDISLVKKFLPKINPTSFKNQLGHLALICGSSGMLGAAYMAAQAALRTGTGLVTSALPKQNMTAFISSPEIMTFKQEKISLDWTEKFNALVIGCGLGKKEDTWKKINQIINYTDLPVILDAEAFHVIKDWAFLKKGNFVLTPHLGEFLALTGFKKPENNKEKVKQSREFSVKYKTTLVLKGAPGIVATANGDIYINSTGNPGMATAGSGDVLAGIIGGFLARGLSPLEASLLGVWFHGMAGDLAKDNLGEDFMSATSMISFFSDTFKLLRA